MTTLRQKEEIGATFTNVELVVWGQFLLGMRNQHTMLEAERD